MKTSDEHVSGRRTFFRTTGVVIAGLGLPIVGLAETENKQNKGIESANSGLPAIEHQVDYVVVGGGIAGTCSAITAARAGLKVVLIQDRPVLGGNASSEIRLWILGATSHMNNNNRWAREGGVHEEILVENMFRNKEGNPVFFDALLIDKVWAEPNITLLLNTAVYQVEMKKGNQIKKVIAFCSQNSTHYEISAPIFCDASGDGILGFLAGAAFRQGAETTEVFGEKFIMPEDYGKLLGHSMYFYSKDAGVPVKYVPPSFALKDIPKHIPRFKDIQRDSSGCRLWWLEWGGELDRVFDSEEIKNELWKVIYGVWDYIKNSGTFENVDNLTLEWASTIPGKRESRRFEGDYTLIQQDIVNQTHFEDAIAHGGWAMDLHPANGVYSTYHGCTQYHSKGVYTIPYRSIYSRNIQNLFLAGRLISVSHAAFGSTRVISTGTLCGQAAALAAKICLANRITPKEVNEKKFVSELQRELIQTGHYIPTVMSNPSGDLMKEAKIHPSSTFELTKLSPDGTWRRLTQHSAMLLPFTKGKIPGFTVTFKADGTATITTSLILSKRLGSYTPDSILATKEFHLSSGTSTVEIDFDLSLNESQYGFLWIAKNDKVSVAQSDVRVTGILAVFNRGIQRKDDKFGLDEIPFYSPDRRPQGKNFALKITPGLKAFDVEQLRTFTFRPAGNNTNAWVASLKEEKPVLNLKWEKPQSINSVVLWFDTDFDHPMESCLMGHPENIMPFCVQEYKILNDKGQLIYETAENHNSRNEIRFEKVVQTSALTVQFNRKHENVPISLFGLQVF